MCLSNKIKKDPKIQEASPCFIYTKAPDLHPLTHRSPPPPSDHNFPLYKTEPAFKPLHTHNTKQKIQQKLQRRPICVREGQEAPDLTPVWELKERPGWY